MCRRHWALVPKPLQRRVWATYQAGQEDGAAPVTADYLRAADEAIDAVFAAEERARTLAKRQIPLFVLLLFLAACATVQARRQCRPTCEHLRGPVLTLFGGPTLAPRSWDECMSACELGEAPAPAGGGP
jgi:hypothetical protein